MEVIIESSLNQNQLSLLIAPKSKEEDFRFYMLKENNPDYLLTMRKLYEGSCIRYLYNTTEKASVKGAFFGQRLNEETVKSLIIQLLEALMYGRDYYLDEDSFLMNPEYIYWDSGKRRCYFCYCPDYSEPIRQQVSNIVSYFMNQVDYEDIAAVKLVYQLYQMTGEEYFSTEKVLRYLNNYQFEEEKKKEKSHIITSTPELNKEMEAENMVSPAIQTILDRGEEIPLEEPASKTPSDLHRETLVFVLVTAAFLLLFCVGYALGLFYTRVGYQLDLKKVSIYVVLVLIVEGYIAWKAFGDPEDNTGETTALEYKLVSCNESTFKPILMNTFPFIIGNDSNQVSQLLLSTKVSRMHAVFTKIDGKLYLKDTSSLNGTYVNDMQLKPQSNHLVHIGDTIRFADEAYRLTS